MTAPVSFFSWLGIGTGSGTGIGNDNWKGSHMALKMTKVPPAQPKAQPTAPLFEEPSWVEEEPAQEAPAPTATTQPAPEANDKPKVAQEDKPTTTALAKAPTGNTAVAGPISHGTVLRQLQNAIGVAELESLSIGVFPRITVGLDGFSVDKSKELGKKIKIEVLSWNFLWLVTTGENTDNAEANKLIRTSYDGVNIKNGEGRVDEYVAVLKAQGYEKAAVRQYIEVYCNLLWSEAGGEIPVNKQQIHQLSLSPQSVGQWQRYLLETGMRKARGIEDSNVVVVTQEKKIIGPNRFGIATFSPN
jgi:hypothetical protein